MVRYAPLTHPTVLIFLLEYRSYCLEKYANQYRRRNFIIEQLLLSTRLSTHRCDKGSANHVNYRQNTPYMVVMVCQFFMWLAVIYPRTCRNSLEVTAGGFLTSPSQFTQSGEDYQLIFD
jgi:hypothetical protein